MHEYEKQKAKLYLGCNYTGDFVMLLISFLVNDIPSVEIASNKQNLFTYMVRFRYLFMSQICKIVTQ